MSYRVELASAALATLQRAPTQVLSRLSGPIEALGATPRPDSSRRVGGEDSAWQVKIGKYRVSYREDTTWRIMIGPFRVLYDVYDDRSLVVVLKIDRRADANNVFNLCLQSGPIRFLIPVPGTPPASGHAA